MATVEEDRLRLQLKASTERLVAPVFPAVVGKGLGYIELAGHAEWGGGGFSTIHASTSTGGVRLLQLTQPKQKYIIMSGRQTFITHHGIVYIRWISLSKQNTISYCETGAHETIGYINSICPFSHMFLLTLDSECRSQRH